MKILQQLIYLINWITTHWENLEKILLISLLQKPAPQTFGDSYASIAGYFNWVGSNHFCPGLLLLFSCQFISDSLRPHGLQHARLPCPSLSPGVCPSSCPLSRWCHPTISSCVAPFSFCPQSFPASGSFPMSQLFASGVQSIGASASVLPMNIQGWFPLRLTGLISLQSKGLSRVFSKTTVQKHQFFGAQPSLWSCSHIRTCYREVSKAPSMYTVVHVLVHTHAHPYLFRL